MQISDSIKQYILGTESFRAKAYADGMSNGVQMYSIGYGHQIQPSEAYLLTATITTDQASALFDSDIQPIETQADGNGLLQDAFDACCDFGFNCGSGALANILSTWNANNDPVATTAEMSLYNKSTVGGVLTVNSDLVARRAYEVNLFLSDYPAGGDTVDTSDTSDSSSTSFTLQPGQSITIIAGLLAIGFAFFYFS